MSQSGAYPGGSQPAHVWDYWAVVMKRAIYVIGFCLICVSISYFVTKQQPKKYRATATVLILPPSVIGATDPFSPAIMSDEVYLNTQLAILATPETIDRAIKSRNLSASPDFQNKSAAEIGRLAYGNVECSRRRNLYLVDVSVTGPEPKVLDDLTNALVDTFKDMQKSASKRLLQDRRARYETEMSQADAQIRLLNIDKTGALQGQNFAETTFVSDYNTILASAERFGVERDKLYIDLMREEPTVNAIKDAQQDAAKGLDAIAQLEFMRGNVDLLSVEKEIDALGEQRKELLKGGIGEMNEKVKEVDAKLDTQQRWRRRTIETAVRQFLGDHENKQRNHQGLVAKVESKNQELKAAAEVKRVVDEKNAEIERHRENKAAATKQLEILNQNADDDKDAVQIASTAVEPPMPFSPNMSANMTMGLVFGIVGGVALAFLLDYLDDTIRTKDELAKVAPDVPLLGIVPNIEARKSEIAKKDLFAANQPKSTISEAYRGVRTALTLSARGPQQKSILLTSAGPREGKTTTAINLATVLAFSGARTLIIDADLRKPRIHASFGLPNTKGLTNLIVGDESPLDLCQRSSIERVDVLTSGPIPPNPSELLGRPRMREALRKLREHYDHIVIDTPPIGAVTDAAVIATMVDGVILVVHAGKTRRQIVSRGIEQLRYISAPIVGVILNNLHLGRGRYYPGYYHYYYYYASHYGAEDGEAKKGKSAKSAAPTAPPANPDGGASG